MGKLAVYDRAVTEYLQGDHQSAIESVAAAGDELDLAVNHYFNDPPPPLATPESVQLRIELAHHIAQGEKLAASPRSAPNGWHGAVCCSPACSAASPPPAVAGLPWPTSSPVAQVPV